MAKNYIVIIINNETSWTSISNPYRKKKHAKKFKEKCLKNGLWAGVFDLKDVKHGKDVKWFVKELSKAHEDSSN